MPTVIDETTQTARKRHSCDSCGRAIEPGDTYTRQRCVDGGDAWVHKAHQSCHAAALALHKQGICGDDGALLNVSDMDREDRAAVFAVDPDAYRACWPHAPEPGQPAPVQ